ncbi:hypothetical protein OG439_08080 [Amycolatopsis sp. NBC_01307]|uniref:COG1470 family protein n=1 Tax=Amycolatopsis sp. NBC_01307 TaxID=2903561 RepID=UPI002E0F666F|nr:hypothetical protein OG439_08080 [Amycolatopsis sp. NBC_01307]
MGATTSLPDEQVSVAPGDSVTCDIEVHNDGQVVDRFLLDVVGDATDWVTVSPGSVSVFPGERETATITFSPPKSPDVLAGEVPFAVRVMSSEDTEGSTVHEGTVLVEEYSEIEVELVPRTARGSRAGRQQLVIDNKGNHDVPVEVRIVDPEDQLAGRTPTPALRTAPGTATVVLLKLRPHKRFLRGATKTLPYQVDVLPQGADPITVDSALVQDAMIPKWLIPLVALLVTAAIVLTVLWFTLFKPVLASTARTAAAEQNAALSSQVSEAAAKASQAEQAAHADDAGGASSTAPSATLVPPTTSPAPAQQQQQQANPSQVNSAPSVAANTAPAPVAVSAAAAPAQASTDFRIQASAPPAAVGAYTIATYFDPARRTVNVRDLVLENPSGDVGLLQIRRGNAVLLSFGLQNFRDMDYHFVQPIVFPSGTPVVVAVSCQNTGKLCTPAVYFSGTAG